jgi:hypothetical protein
VEPPVAASVELYPPATNPPGSCAVEICKGADAAFTVSVATLLVTLPAELLTTAENCAPLSELDVEGVV